jgi:hypothetical protein
MDENNSGTKYLMEEVSLDEVSPGRSGSAPILILVKINQQCDSLISIKHFHNFNYLINGGDN